MPFPFRHAGFGLVAALGACTMPADGDGPTGLAALTGDGECGAASRQDLVGTSVGTLDSASLPEGTRVLFPGMAATTDLREDRLNVEVGGNDTVVRVYCG